jgi:hypothetical protein
LFCSGLQGEFFLTHNATTILVTILCPCSKKPVATRIGKELKNISQRCVVIAYNCWQQQQQATTTFTEINYFRECRVATMAKQGKKGKEQGRKRMKQQFIKDVDEEDLGRFAGSSDEESGSFAEVQSKTLVSRSVDEETPEAYIYKDMGVSGSREIEDEIIPNSAADEDEDDDDASFIGSIEKGEDPAFKMANVMGQILSGQEKRRKNSTANVVLGKTVTSLQKLQQQEREKAKALKEKRQAHRERNLSALHIPLSIATSNNVATEGRLSVAKELEQERFHRRVATRGVVALFNAISQHQRSHTQVSGCTFCFAMSFCDPCSALLILPSSLVLDILATFEA